MIPLDPKAQGYYLVAKSTRRHKKLWETTGAELRFYKKHNGFWVVAVVHLLLGRDRISGLIQNCYMNQNLKQTLNMKKYENQVLKSQKCSDVFEGLDS